MTLGLGAVCRIGAKVVTVTVNSESDRLVMAQAVTTWDSGPYLSNCTVESNHDYRGPRASAPAAALPVELPPRAPSGNAAAAAASASGLRQVSHGH